MRHALALAAVLLLAACAASPAPSADPAVMSDEALCFAAAEKTPAPGVLAELQRRDLNCAVLLGPDSGPVASDPRWQEKAAAITRAAQPPR